MFLLCNGGIFLPPNLPDPFPTLLALPLLLHSLCWALHLAVHLESLGIFGTPGTSPGGEADLRAQGTTWIMESGYKISKLLSCAGKASRLFHAPISAEEWLSHRLWLKAGLVFSPQNPGTALLHSEVTQIPV